MLRLTIAAVLPLALASCAGTPPPELATLTAPADPSLGIRRIKHSNPLGGYVHRNVSEPGEWRKPAGSGAKAGAQ